MKKIRTIDQLEDFISREYSWRRKELTNLRNVALSARKSTKSSLLRFSVAALYAHWEGFVKGVSIAYLEYLVYQGLAYDTLSENFKVFAILEYFEGNFPHKQFSAYLELVNLRNIDTKNSFKINPSKYIDTKSNLNSNVLKDINLKIGISNQPYELKANFIDESFVGLRNAISHGEYREIEEDDFEELYREATSLIETFRNQILNCAIQKSYLSSA